MTTFNKLVNESHDGSPESAFTRQSRSIDNSVDIIVESWHALRLALSNQLDRDPEQWQGIGRGSELGQINYDLKQVARSLKSAARIYSK
jgi:hypothetical protein